MCFSIFGGFRSGLFMHFFPPLSRVASWFEGPELLVNGVAQRSLQRARTTFGALNRRSRQLSNRVKAEPLQNYAFTYKLMAVKHFASVKHTFVRRSATPELI
jgi:hypothetical protein